MTNPSNPPEERLPECMSVRVSGVVPVSAYRISQAMEDIWVATFYVEHKLLTSRILLLAEVEGHGQVVELCEQIANIGWAKVDGELVDSNVIWGSVVPWQPEDQVDLIPVDEPIMVSMAQDPEPTQGFEAPSILVRFQLPVHALPGDFPESVEFDGVESAAFTGLIKAVLNFRAK